MSKFLKSVMAVVYSVAVVFSGAMYSEQVLDVYDQVETIALDTADLVRPEPKPVLKYIKGASEIYLYETRCKDKDVLATAKAMGIPRWAIKQLKRVDATFDGVKSKACYLDSGMVLDITQNYAGPFDIGSFEPMKGGDPSSGEKKLNNPVPVKPSDLMLDRV